MAGQVSDIEKLIRLQELDNVLQDGAEQFNNSPIAAEIKEVREKKSQYKSKRDQVDAVFVKARDEVEKVGALDSKLAADQDRMQKEIEKTQGDYRKVEAQTQKLNELTNQRKQVDEKLEKLEANFNKIKELKQKLDSAIEAVSMKEDDLNRNLESTNAQLKMDMDAASNEKESLEKEISADALATYKRARGIVGKIVISKLSQNTCAVCRSPLSSGGLSKVNDEAPIAVCPNCSRVLIVK